MGFFDLFDLENKENSKIKELAKKLNGKDFEYKDTLVKYLAEITSGDKMRFCSDEFLCQIIEKNIGAFNFEYSYILKEIYDATVYNENDDAQVRLFNTVLEYYSCNNEKIQLDKIKIICNLFSDKKLLTSLFIYLKELQSSVHLLDYIIEMRQYFVDENAFLSNIMSVSTKMNVNPSVNRAKIAEEYKKKTLQQMGLIDISISELEQKYNKICAMSADIDKVMDEIVLLQEKSKNMGDWVEKKIDDFTNEKIKLFITKTQDALSAANDIGQKIETLAQSKLNAIENKSKQYIRAIDQKLCVVPEEERKSILTKGIKVEEKTSSKYFDESIPFADRYNMALKAKNSNEIYHNSFDKIVKRLILNMPVMLIGPSGSGKTYTVKQAAKLLELKLYNFGFVADEITTIKGYNDAQGNFIATPFYDLYKNGGLCFFDEVDNSESKALMEINKIVGSDGYEPYLFPNGELVTPHPNFRIIAAGNTWGDGADELYSSREKLDAATMDRFATVEYEYSKNIEDKILKDYMYLYEFLMCYRDYIEERNYDDVMTTRGLEFAKKYIETDTPIEEIIEERIIKNKRYDTLSAIVSYMDSNLSQKNKALVKFKQMVNERR